MVVINTLKLKQTCAWFAIVDSDTYVNTESVGAKLRAMNPAEVHFMGPWLEGRRPDQGFIHGSFKLLSQTAVPEVATAVARCDDVWSSDWDDLQLGHCMHNFDIKLERFGQHIAVNGHDSLSGALPAALEASQKTRQSLKCFDYVHKLLPTKMYEYHQKFKESSDCNNRPGKGH